MSPGQHISNRLDYPHCAGCGACMTLIFEPVGLDMWCCLTCGSFEVPTSGEGGMRL